MAKIIIHRGREQIGGSITEITSATSRIFVDFGAELPGEGKASSDQQMIDRIKCDPPQAVLFSHYHGDHVGLLAEIPPSVTIYMGAVARQVLLNIREALLGMKDLDGKERGKLQKEYNILCSDQVLTYNTEHKEISVPGTDIIFIPYPVDHSAYDAYMFRIHCDGEVIVHTGDYRNHGRLGRNFFNMVEEEVACIPVDYLITEGTMMSRDKEKVLTEKAMQKKALDILKEQKYVFLVCSSTNLESLSSFYWAMILASKQVKGQESRPLIVNRYVKKQLDLFTNTAGKDNRQFQFFRSYAIEKGLQKRLSTGQTQEEYMKEHGFVMMVGTSRYYRELIHKFDAQKPMLIYSMWEGYLDPKEPAFNAELKDLVDSFGSRCVCLHTSGHATPDVIARMIQTVNPRKEIIPIHTEYAAGFLKLNISEEMKRKIQRGDKIGR